ncbi:MAG: phosphoglycerate transporter [Chloroflexi bacterium]|nr:phosphoglycerate transporter [Chloroflexota bacterium]
MYQLGWFSTARGKGSRDLLTAVQDSIQHGEINAEIVFVFCSREPGESPETDLFLQLVDSYHIPLVSFSYQKFKAKYGGRVDLDVPLPRWRLDYDREVMKLLERFHPDLCVLAGWMLVTGPDMCRKYKMINLHPAAPDGPKGTWQQVIWQLIHARAQRTGVMMHLVTPELDRGPVVTYCTFSIRGKPFDQHWRKLETLPHEEPERQKTEESLFNLIREHGLKREFPLIIATIKAFSEGQVKVVGGQAMDAAGKTIEGYDLTGEIDRAVA